MIRRSLAMYFSIVALALSTFAQKSSTKMSTGPAPDKAYLQHVLDTWSTLNPADMAQYYAQGDRLFFDIAPVKYSNWAEYQKGVTELLKGYKSLKLTLSDDAQLHREGDLLWAAGTLKEDAVAPGGKHELATMRWTVIFQKMDGKWLIVHEHTSEPLQ
jgi:ketosteroid isomerase-like protein